MALALTLSLGLLAGNAGGGCYFVTNTQILRIPSCEVGPATIEELTEDPGPSSGPSGRVNPRRTGAANRRSPAVSRVVRPVPARAKDVLERRIEKAQQERVAAVAERLAAERERDRALRERDAALRELAKARTALAAERARAAPAAPEERARDGRTEGGGPDARR